MGLVDFFFNGSYRESLNSRPEKSKDRFSDAKVGDEVELDGLTIRVEKIHPWVIQGLVLAHDTSKRPLPRFSGSITFYKSDGRIVN